MAAARTQKRGRTRLTRERIVRAAVAIADRQGVENVSMRKVATRLKVEAMSLYHHVANKEELLDGMVDAVFAEVELQKGAPDWRAAMRARAGSLRAALARHPWATPLLDSRTQPGLATLTHHDAVIGCLREAGFSWELTAHAFSLMDSYIYGFTLQEEALPVEPGDDWQEVGQQMAEQLPADQFPALASFVSEHVLRAGYSHTKEFEYGLELVLDGLERRRADISPRAERNRR
jgi:AcrR family transcriptional regulator